jgi:23S rRNA pseudouridine2605 synthase
MAEGRKHEIKRLFSHFDLKIIRLKRVAIGPVSLDDLVTGKIERLDDEQVRDLYRFVDSLSLAEQSGSTDLCSL